MQLVQWVQGKGARREAGRRLFRKNWDTIVLRELNFTLSRIDVGHLDKPFSPKEKKFCPKYFIVWTTCHLCHFEVQILSPLLVKVFTTSLSCSRFFVLRAKALLFF